MTTLKFIHAADIHLGRPFSGLRRSSPELGNLFLQAGYDAWDRIVTTAIDRSVDFLTLGGDVFDAPNPTVRARVAFKKGVERLHDARIPIYLAVGNHDPLKSFPESLRTLPGLHLFGPNPEGMRFAGQEQTDGVMIFGAGFEKAVITDNLVRKFRRDPGVDLAIGVVHTNVAGTSGHENYSPCTLDDLKAAGMDIWCLGHVHSSEVLSQDPLILYPGTSQGAHINESGLRGCHLIVAQAGSAAVAEFIPLAPCLLAQGGCGCDGVSQCRGSRGRGRGHLFPYFSRCRHRPGRRGAPKPDGTGWFARSWNDSKRSGVFRGLVRTAGNAVFAGVPRICTRFDPIIYESELFEG